MFYTNYPTMKARLLPATFLLFASSIFAQKNIGIGTTYPDSSAILHVSSESKGVLLPRIFLKSTADNTTIKGPINGLLVYNNNKNLKWGYGFYYNNGTSDAPSWQSVSDLTLPYYKVANTATNAFQIENYTSDTHTSAIKGNHPKGYGIEGATLSGIGVYANAGPGVGVYTISESGYGLKTHGKLYIGGNGQAPAAGKVLTSDVDGNATWEGGIAFSVSGVKPNTLIKNATVPFSTKDYDLGNNYDMANYTFTATVRGIYHFEVMVTYGYLYADFESRISLERIRSGQVVRLFEHCKQIDGSDYSSQYFGKDVFAEPGDQFRVHANVYDSDPQPVHESYQLSHFTGRLVMVLK